MLGTILHGNAGAIGVAVRSREPDAQNPVGVGIGVFERASQRPHIEIFHLALGKSDVEVDREYTFVSLIDRVGRNLFFCHVDGTAIEDDRRRRARLAAADRRGFRSSRTCVNRAPGDPYGSATRVVCGSDAGAHAARRGDAPAGDFYRDARSGAHRRGIARADAGSVVGSHGRDDTP